MTAYETALLKVLDASLNRSVAFKRVSMVTGHKSESKFMSAVDRFRQTNWVVEEGEQMLSVVLDRKERQRIINRLVTAELQMAGLS